MIKNRFEKRSLKRSELYDETLDIEEVWKPKKRPKEEIETKTNSKYFVNAKTEKITPKVSKKLYIYTYIQFLVVFTIYYTLGASDL